MTDLIKDIAFALGVWFTSSFVIGVIVGVLLRKLGEPPRIRP